MGVIIGIWNITMARALFLALPIMPLQDPLFDSPTPGEIESEVLGYTADSTLSGATPLVFAFCEDALTSYPACINPKTKEWDEISKKYKLTRDV